MLCSYCNINFQQDCWRPFNAYGELKDLTLPGLLLRLYKYIHIYETVADVSESWVWWRANFQSCSRVLKNGHYTAHRAVERSVSSYYWCMVLHVIAWYCMIVHGIAWYCMVLHGMAWYCMVFHGIAWCCMAWHGIAWYCMALHGIALYYMVLHGVA